MTPTSRTQLKQQLQREQLLQEADRKEVERKALQKQKSSDEELKVPLQSIDVDVPPQILQVRLLGSLHLDNVLNFFTLTGPNKTRESNALSRHSEAEKSSETISQRVVQVHRLVAQFDSLLGHSAQHRESVQHQVPASNRLQFSDDEEQYKLQAVEPHPQSQWLDHESECERSSSQQRTSQSGLLVRSTRIEHESAFHVPTKIWQHHCESLRGGFISYVTNTELGCNQRHQRVRGELILAKEFIS